MEFLLLGRLEIRDLTGRPVILSRRKERCLLGVLLLHAGQVVPAERLVRLLWEGDPPRDPRATLRTYVSRLRKSLGGDLLRAASGGYAADVEPERVDVHQFTRRVTQARAEPDPARRAHLLAGALALWRGPLLADEATDLLRERIGAELAGRRLAAAEWQVDAELDSGHHEEVIGPLSTLVAEHPLHEPFVDRLMVALHRTGRHAAALDAYHLLRTRLETALRTEPGAEIHARYLAILRERPAPAAPAGAGTVDRRVPMPAQLPPAVPCFTGRRNAQRELDRLLDNDTGDGPLVATLAGTAGVGKTALAVHWAHRVADRFPDGQLYVDLHGYDPDQPMPPAAALSGFLRTLGVAAADIPAGAAERACFFRSLLAGRRVLVLLDNARSAEQVRPLLPGTPGCLALVTSRDDLADLAAHEGAWRIVLDRLPDAEAVELLRRILGVNRVAMEPEAAAKLVNRCAGLPLALRVAAERAAGRPATFLAELIAELDDHDRGLDALDVPGDPVTGLREVFSWSYHALSPAAARLFRILGLHPGPDLNAAAAGDLAGLGPAPTARLLDQLGRVHLIEQSRPGRFRLHDLLRFFARERAETEEPPAERAAAVHRLAAGYLLLARRAHELAFPAVPLVLHDLPPAAPALGSPEDAHAWFAAERDNLLATIRRAASVPASRPLAVRLTIALAHLARAWGAGAEWIDILDRTLVAARADGDAASAGRLLVWRANLGDDPDRAARDLAEAAKAFRALGDRDSELIARINEAVALHQLGRRNEAERRYRVALRLARVRKNRRLEGYVLANIAAVDRETGDYTSATAHARAARDIFHDIGDWVGETDALDDLAETLRAAGDRAAAIEARRTALAVLDLRDAEREGRNLHELGKDLHVIGDTAAALDSFRRAVIRLTDARAAEAAEEAARSLAAVQGR